MPNLFPGATWRPMPGQEKRPKRRKGRGVGFHIAVSERPSIYDINLGTGNDAHLYVRRDGGCEQNVDLDLQAYAGRDGNASMIWVETQGGTTAADVKSGRWTPQQAETLAQIAAYANQSEGTPLQVMPDSRPASRGIGTHRLGIRHSRGIGAVPGWLVAGGELWSSAVGKECPGDARIGQVPQIVARAKDIRRGSPAPKEDDDMPRFDLIRNRDTGAMVLAAPGVWYGVPSPAYLTLYQARGLCPATALDIPGNEFDHFRDIYLTAVIDTPIPRSEQAGGGVTTLRAQAQWEDYNLRTVVPEKTAKLVTTPQVDVDALASKMAAALAGKGGLSRDDVKAALREVLREGVGANDAA